ncbi:methyl-accepting chemotaxis protein [Paenibacillus xerothermodurans]|uniref:Methyl-accepting chemotaxis protein n=1 Tax=Paenibacillus xerothermodurans TaxID=1977292 RepID=A0A2W1N8G5_PAEXE|nr:methyl-accepting chemotaxis protein [Paenibacillus xerothermodurans]PZE20184.1 methyl-accepting chemotaxis protein [Paenibacillus xerothermodurans]
MRSMSIATKICLIVVGILLSFSALVAYQVLGDMRTGIETFATEKAKSDLELTAGFIQHKYPGDWQIKDGQMYKGNTKINENFDLVDEIGTITGDTVTIFQGERRVTTNVLTEGKRAIGTAVSAQVADVVLKKGEKYYGEALVVGQTYQTAYQPIKNASGEVIGILYIGASQQLINGIIQSFIGSFFYVFSIAMVVSVAVIVWYIRKMRTRISRVAEAMEQAGAGDFTTVITDHSLDEIGKLGLSFNSMKESLQDLIQQGLSASDKVVAATKTLQVIAEQTANQTKQIVSSIGKVASGADSQTQSTAENLRAMEEVAVGVQRIAENASTITESAFYSKQQAETGGEYVHKTAQQMDSIHESVQDTDSVIKSLERKSQEIAGVLGIIRGIATQTNLLALNAGIEAARAGEHGRGFAVVATEVRRLAEQSAESSGQIADLLSDIEKDMKRSIDAMAQVIEEVHTGLELTKETDRNFVQIVKSNAQIAEQIEEMAATAEQMSAGVEQITASVTEIAQIAQVTNSNSQQVAASTQEQLAAMEEIASSSSELTEVSDVLERSLGKFKL